MAESKAVQEAPLLKIVGPVWGIIGTTLAGVAVIVVLSVPWLSAHARAMIPIAAVAGFIIAIPFAFVVAARMRDSFMR